MTGGIAVNIQIFGKNKCFDTKKAERYFKERRVSYQQIDLLRYGLSKGEFQSVKRAVGLQAMIDPKSKEKEAAMLPYLASDEAIEEKLMENPKLLKTPIVRNGKQATVGFCPEIWKTWE